MRSKKKFKKITPIVIARLSAVHKHKSAQILVFSSKMYAQNPCCAYIFYSIIIETRPTERTPPQSAAGS